MCRNILLAILAILALFFASIIAAWQYLGCWSVPIVFFLWLVLARVLAKVAFARLMILPYLLHGRALQKARAQVHAIEKLDRPAPARRHDIIDVDSTGGVRPADLSDSARAALPAGQDIIDPIREPAPETPPASDLPRSLIYRVDLTITPRHTAAWNPASLTLIPASAKLNPTSLTAGITPTRVELFRTFDSGSEAGNWLDFDPANVRNCVGTQRVRLTYELPLTSSEKRFKMCYFLGSVTLISFDI